MKTNKPYKVKSERVHSLRDLELEKARLQLEILKAKENIHSDYRRILDSFTLKNLASVMVQDMATSSGIVSKTFGLGKSFFAKKKKKKLKEKEIENEKSTEA